MRLLPRQSRECPKGKLWYTCAQQVTQKPYAGCCSVNVCQQPGLSGKCPDDDEEPDTTRTVTEDITSTVIVNPTGPSTSTSQSSSSAGSSSVKSSSTLKSLTKTTLATRPPTSSVSVTPTNSPSISPLTTPDPASSGGSNNGPLIGSLTVTGVVVLIIIGALFFWRRPLLAKFKSLTPRRRNNDMSSEILNSGQGGFGALGSMAPNSPNMPAVLPATGSDGHGDHPRSIVASGSGSSNQMYAESGSRSRGMSPGLYAPDKMPDGHRDGGGYGYQQQQQKQGPAELNGGQDPFGYGEVGRGNEQQYHQQNPGVPHPELQPSSPQQQKYGVPEIPRQPQPQQPQYGNPGIHPYHPVCSGIDRTFPDPIDGIVRLNQHGHGYIPASGHTPPPPPLSAAPTPATDSRYSSVTSFTYPGSQGRNSHNHMPSSNNNRITSNSSSYVSYRPDSHQPQPPHHHHNHTHARANSLHSFYAELPANDVPLNSRPQMHNRNLSANSAGSGRGSFLAPLERLHTPLPTPLPRSPIPTSGPEWASLTHRPQLPPDEVYDPTTQHRRMMEERKASDANWGEGGMKGSERPIKNIGPQQRDQSILPKSLMKEEEGGEEEKEEEEEKEKEKEEEKEEKKDEEKPEQFEIRGVKYDKDGTGYRRSDVPKRGE